MKHLKKLMILLCLSGKLASAGPYHTNFYYEGGNFHQVHLPVGAEPRWVERQDSGTFFLFKEEVRNDSYIQLFDRSRTLRVRIYDDRFELSADGYYYSFFKAGHFDDRDTYYYRNAEGKVARVEFQGGKRWFIFDPGHRNGHYEEDYRGEALDGGIKLVGNGEKLWLDRDGFFRLSGLRLYKIAVGQWNAPLFD